MPTLLDFRRRIRSVKSTQQITRAMKFVAAARLRRAQERVFAARPYASHILSVLCSAMARVENPSHPLMVRRPAERLLLLVVSGDRGMCGAFNANVVRKAEEFLRQHRSNRLDVVPVGKKARDALRKRGIRFAVEYLNIAARVEFAQAKDIAAKAVEKVTSAEVDAVYAIYNEFKSVLAQRLVVEKILPIDPEGLVTAGTLPEAAGSVGGYALPTHVSGQVTVLVDYIYEQPAGELLDRLLHRYVDVEVYRVLLESAAAESAARMTAMDAATNNASELIEQLTLHMNKVRQAAITKEIIEVVSGAASAAS